MKKRFCFLIAVIICHTVTAQNVGIGTAEPLNKLQVAGNLLVIAPTTVTNASPTAAQTKTILNAGTILYAGADSTGRIYDPGGPAGNYNANATGNASITSSSACVGIELTAESIQLGTGDSLTIKASSNSLAYLLAVDNGYSGTGKWVFNSSGLYIIFKSNADLNVGSGFSLLFKRLYDNSASLPDVAGETGKALFFDSKTGSFRTGANSNNARGNYSSALGWGNTASGNYSSALGALNDATGIYAVAEGYNNTASGSYSVALGNTTEASGNSSAAIGHLLVASGDNATAFGYNSYAIGNYATAMGFQNRAEAHYTTVMGKFNRATGYASIATGDSTVAGGRMSFAGGFRTTASGDYSAALGFTSTASGFTSTALGNTTTANGSYSTAMGYGTTASGFMATAMGVETSSGGAYSTALGHTTNASGSHSTAMGYNTTASGNRSTAIGNYVSTNSMEGALVIGDYSTQTILNAATPNSFRARFEGGYRFFTSAAAITSESCLLASGRNAWSTASDVRLKENFEPVLGEEFLKKISAMNLTSWNYKKQNPQSFRHYGPMAQDFYAAFGKDSYGTIGNDTSINSADFDGVNLIAIQALEKRTQKIQQLENANTKLQKELDDLKMRLQKLEAICSNKQQ